MPTQSRPRSIPFGLDIVGQRGMPSAETTDADEIVEEKDVLLDAESGDAAVETDAEAGGVEESGVPAEAEWMCEA